MNWVASALALLVAHEFIGCSPARWHRENYMLEGGQHRRIQKALENPEKRYRIAGEAVSIMASPSVSKYEDGISKEYGPYRITVYFGKKHEKGTVTILSATVLSAIGNVHHLEDSASFPIQVDLSKKNYYTFGHNIPLQWNKRERAIIRMKALIQKEGVMVEGEEYLPLIPVLDQGEGWKWIK